MSVNKVIILGFVGNPPETKQFDNGSKTTFQIATTDKGYTAKNGTVIPDRTEWHNIVCIGKLSEIAEKYVQKGTQLYIEGKIRTRTYDDKNGIKRYVFEIYADVLQLLGKSEQSRDENRNEPSSQVNGQSERPTSTSIQDDDDDLPF